LPRPGTTCAEDDPPAETPVREMTGPGIETRGEVVLVGLETVVVEVLEDEPELEETEEGEGDEPEVLVTRGDVPDEPVTEMTGVPVGRAGRVTTTVPLPDLTTGVPGLLEPEPPEPLPEPPEPLPEPPEPLPEPPEPLPEPVDTGVVGVLATGVGVATTGTVGAVTVVVPPPVLPVPVLPLPVPPLPEPVPDPVLVGVELCVGCRAATGCEMAAELEWCTRVWPTVPWPTCASSVLSLATAAGTPAAPPVCAVTTLTDASPREE
jgi:hypothetical protein